LGGKGFSNVLTHLASVCISAERHDIYLPEVIGAEVLDESALLKMPDAHARARRTTCVQRGGTAVLPVTGVGCAKVRLGELDTSQTGDVSEKLEGLILVA